MTFVTPPQGWELDVGIWGTDANREETIVVSGGYSVKFNSTAVATALVSPWIPIEDLLQSFYGALLRTDDVTAGYTITLKVDQYDHNRLFVGTSTMFTGVLDAIDTWQWVGNIRSHLATIGWVRMRLEKTTDTHNVYVDNMLTERLQPSWGLYRDSLQTIATGTWTTLATNSSLVAAQSYFLTISRSVSAAGVVTIGPPGAYNFHSAIELDDFAAPGVLDIRLKLTPKGGGASRFRYGTRSYLATGFGGRAVVSVTNEQLFPGDTAEVQIFQNSGFNVSTVLPDTQHSYNHLTGSRIGKI